ncbi:MAG: DUF6134 family protein [Pseudomonadales bacterium]|jgi:hypothetical protein|nr:DUF6134 family protein [Pseudomonadales bacterium]
MLAALLLLCSPLLPAQTPALPPDRHFRVLLGDREVGDHHFRFSREGEAIAVHSEAGFRVKLAFVTVYRYDHDARERWRDGCLVGLESTTDDNGTDYRVEAAWHDGVLSVSGTRDSRSVRTQCPWTFAYWNPDLREREELFNAQTGERLEVEVRPLGPRTLQLAGAERTFPAWKLDAEGMDLVVYYDSDGRWMGIDSTLENGRVLRYRPAQDDPAWPSP